MPELRDATPAEFHSYDIPAVGYLAAEAAKLHLPRYGVMEGRDRFYFGVLLL